MDEYMILKKARLDKAIDDRQDLIDNPERRNWMPGTRPHPEKTQFTHLLYKLFPRCKPALYMALNAIVSDFNTDIWQMIESYKGVKVWIIMKFRYEPANSKDNEKKLIKTYVSSKSTQIYTCKPMTAVTVRSMQSRFVSYMNG